MTDNKKLKKCPFCGNEPEITTDVQDVSFGIEVDEPCGVLGLCNKRVIIHPTPNYHFTAKVICPNCGTSTKASSEYQAIIKWNRRTK